MPRIAVAIFVVVAVSVSIGINIARYPAVFESVGATHESLVSDDTKDVPKKAETEGTVAVKTMSAMPDENLAQYNVPLQNGPGSTATEAIPYVASNVNHNSGISESVEPMATTEETPTEARQPSYETNEYEVRPSHPYTSRPTVASPASLLNETTETNETFVTSNEAPAETSYRDSYEKYREMYERRPSIPNDSPAREDPGNTPVNTPVDTVQAERENHPPGFWPATVSETFRYRSESVEHSSDSFYDRSSSPTPVMNVSSREVTPSSESEVSRVEVASRSAEPNVVYRTENKWRAVTPKAAIRNNFEGMSLKSHLERLPEVRGADVLPGALPMHQTIDYPVTE